MGPKRIQGSQELGQEIRERRLELDMTIEEAAREAGVGIKTWCRYEAGGAIRNDKKRGICKALIWRYLPGEEEAYKNDKSLQEYMKSDSWSDVIAEAYGKYAATAFVIGSEILLDEINQDMEELSKRPQGTHIGELDFSVLADIMPAQFLMRYEYEFLYAMKSKLKNLCAWVKNGNMRIHSVLEEILLYLVMEEAEILMDSMNPTEDWREWIYDICGDADMEMLLYEEQYVTGDNIYHFDYWLEEQFNC